MKRTREIIFFPARDLLGRETQNAEAAEAVALFGFQVKKWVGAFSTMLGGLDIQVFADGIGENAPRSAMGWDSWESS